MGNSGYFNDANSGKLITPRLAGCYELKSMGKMKEELKEAQS